ncbi:MAG: hypothetical protein WDO12_07535 [Pseudomonadota bacterium]
MVGANNILSNLDSYTDAAGGADNGSYRVVSGTTKRALTYNNTTIPAGKNVMYFYKFNGGSYTNGIAPFAPTLPGFTGTLPFPTVAIVTTGATAIASPAAGKPTYQSPGVYANTVQQRAPDWGVADVEVALFRGFNNPTGNAGGTVANTNGGAAPVVGATTGIYDNLFGVAVTANVFTGAHPKTNFSKADVTGILQGGIQDWGQLLGDDGQPLPAGPIFFLDRGEGSGSKAAGNEYFLNYPASGSSALLPNSASNGYTATTLNVNAVDFQDVNESSTGTLIADLKAAQAAGKRAIAIMGLESPPKSQQVAGANVYYFTKINGVGVDSGTTGDDINGTGAGAATSYSNVVKGYYDFYYQNSFNTLAATLGGTAPGSVFANEFKTVMSQPSFVGANAGLAFPNAVPGTLVDASIATNLDPGVTISTRAGDSSAPALPYLNGIAVPLSHEPL